MKSKWWNDKEWRKRNLAEVTLVRVEIVEVNLIFRISAPLPRWRWRWWWQWWWCSGSCCCCWWWRFCSSSWARFWTHWITTLPSTKPTSSLSKNSCLVFCSSVRDSYKREHETTSPISFKTTTKFWHPLGYTRRPKWMKIQWAGLGYIQKNELIGFFIIYDTPKKRKKKKKKRPL